MLAAILLTLAFVPVVIVGLIVSGALFYAAEIIAKLVWHCAIEPFLDRHPVLCLTPLAIIVAYLAAFLAKAVLS